MGVLGRSPEDLARWWRKFVFHLEPTAKARRFSKLRCNGFHLGRGCLPRHRARHANALILPASASDGDVPESPTFGPVAAARLAEVPRLSEVVVVVVTKLGVR